MYSAKDFQHLCGGQSFSDKLLNHHFGLYRNHIDKLNGTIGWLEKISAEGKRDTAEFDKIKGHLSQELDGIRLHELYFENLGGQGVIAKESSILKALEQHFGSFAAWREDFITTASLRGVGWAVLYQDNYTGKLNNLWFSENPAHQPSDGKALLVLDAWDHAYMQDYGLNRIAYIEAFLENLNWNVVEERMQG